MLIAPLRLDRQEDRERRDKGVFCRKPNMRESNVQDEPRIDDCQGLL